MSILAEWLTLLSLAGCLVLVISWYRKDRSSVRLVLRLLLLAAAIIALNRILGFPKILLSPEEATIISKGSDQGEDWLFLASAYVCMILGMLSQYMYSRFALEPQARGRIDWGSLLGPVFVSPIIFLPLCSTIANAQRSGAAGIITLLVAFENGFFFKGYFDQRARANREASQDS
jgi:hypothetical protein